MGGKEGVRFKVNLSEEGSSKLADRLTLALKDYMGDFVDDTLVKYVIVLLGNGRSKEEVKEDLDVFLGDNSDSFATWLWDHLASDIDQYIQPPAPSTNEAAKAKPDLIELNGETDTQPQLISDSEKGKLKSSRRRHNRDWKDLISDETHPPLRSSVTSHHALKEESTHKRAVHMRQSVSPERPLRKRSRGDERTRPKRDASQATLHAPRRLLQFAVREAVATSRLSNPVSEPARKRLRSVVSTPTGNSSEEICPQKVVARTSNPVSTVMRAVAEAAEDVRRVKYGNVFDRLSRGVDKSSKLLSASREHDVQGTGYEDYGDVRENVHEAHVRTRDYSGTFNATASLMGSNTGLASDSASDNEGYDDVNVSGHRVTDISETGKSRGNKADDSLMVQYSVARNTDEITRQSRKKSQEPIVSAGGTKHKIVNISVNVNTWKPPNYQPASKTVEVHTQKLLQENGTGPTSSDLLLMKDNSNPATGLGNGTPAAESQKEMQKTSSAPGPYSTGRPLEDADSRTIFVNNVHFAATKDTLSRHFNKFGEVLKVIILTDAATGHPKGSAYVEFMRKEAAEDSLTLDGTSFMSRIIKVLKKSSVQQEASPTMTWPRITRGASFGVPRFAQAPFPRVFAGPYRGRASMKSGARSMQWKRDTQQMSAESVVSVSGGITNAPSASRGLTYIRGESKKDGSAGGV